MEFINEKLNEFNRYLRNRKIAIIGLDEDNISLIDYMHMYGAEISVFDNKNIEEIEKNIIDKLTQYAIHFSFGKDALSKLNNFEIIFHSPKYSPTLLEIKKEEENGCIVTSMIEMFMKMCPAKMIGVTGSNKTITAKLIYEILKAGEYNCYINEGRENKLFFKLTEITDKDIIVIELSKLQLQEMDISPNIAVIGNIEVNEREELIQAIKNIYRYQNEEEILILNYDSEETKKIKTEACNKIVYFSSENKLEDGWILDNEIIKECNYKLRRHVLNVKNTKLKEKKDYESMCAALAATSKLVDTKIAVNVIENFE